MKYLGLIATAALLVSTAAAQAALPTYPTPGTANAATYSFTATGTGPIVAYFAGTGAAYNEILGLSINGVATGLLGLQNHQSSVGQSFVLGNAQAGDVLNFFINVQETGQTFSTDQSLNTDGVNHVWSTAYAGGDAGIPAGTYIAFEDLTGGGDLNYHDETFVFTNVTSTGGTVPEPASWALMIGGFGMIGAAARRRRSVATTA